MPAITRRNAARHVIAVTPTPGRSLSLLTPRLPVHSPLSFSFHSTVLPFPPSLTHSTHAPVLGRSRGKTGFVLAPVEHQSTGSRIRSFATSHLARLLQTAVYPSPLSQPVIFFLSPFLSACGLWFSRWVGPEVEPCRRSTPVGLDLHIYIFIYIYIYISVSMCTCGGMLYS